LKNRQIYNNKEFLPLIAASSLMQASSGKVDYRLSNNRLSDNISYASNDPHLYNYIGKRQYELSNHLGNVLTVVSDRKYARDIDQNDEVDYFEPDILLTYDYSPFGVILKERAFEKQIASDSSWIDTTYVINDKFNNPSLDGWSKLSGSTGITNSNNTLAITKSGGSNDVGVYKQFIAQECEHYYFSAFVDKGTCNPSSLIEITITDNMANPIYQNTLGSGNGTFTFDFVATSTGAYIITFERIGNNSNCTFYVDNIEVYYEEEMTLCTLSAYSKYRYGFNGMEKDDEVKGSGNSYDFGARMFDSRLGRWLSIDVLADKYPHQSPYNFVANSPLRYVDPTGKDIWIVGVVDGQKTRVKFEAGKPAPENSDPYIQDAFSALQNEIENGNEEIQTLSTNSDIDLTITNDKKYFSSQGSATYSSGAYNDSENNIEIEKQKGVKYGVVAWDNTAGFLSLYIDESSKKPMIFPDDQSQYFAPQDILDHELGHAYSDLVEEWLDKEGNPTGSSANEVRSAMPSTNKKRFSSREEEHNVKKTDNNRGKIRTTDKGGVGYKASSVRDDTPKYDSGNEMKGVKVMKGTVQEYKDN
jgi:RHS repeat-associated protein